MSYWTHTVLELFPKPLDGTLPKSGEPADWIEEKSVYFTQGDDELVIHYYPFHKIIWIKLEKWAEDLHTLWFNNIYVRTPWGKKRMKEVREFISSIPVVSDDEIREMFGDEDADAIEELIHG